MDILRLYRNFKDKSDIMISVAICIFNYINKLIDQTETAVSPWLVPSLARIIFAGTLVAYYWNSALTKIGDNLLSPSLGAYVQIFPKAMEAVGYDPSQLSVFHTLVVLAGTYSEFILPLMIIIGLLSRLAALGMIGFIIVQSVVDIFGHGLSSNDIGSWFDNSPSSLIIDQRSFWIFLLLVIVIKGAGPISFDRYLSKMINNFKG